MVNIILTAVGVVLLSTGLAVLALWPTWRARRHRMLLRNARARFSLRREWLEARFLTLASQSGKPRGLEWVQCDFDNAVRFARDRHTGSLRAFVGVTIGFRAIAGGGMEEVEAVGDLRAATAVFLFENNEWTTNGRVLFNMNPDEAIVQHKLETVD
jgi:hypothetical protein